MIITIKKSRDGIHKFKAIIKDKDTKKTVHFGAVGYQDFTSHKDEKRKKLYILRHKGMNENWTKSGIKTAGFFSRWILWNKPDLEESVRDTEKRFNVKINLEV